MKRACIDVGGTFTDCLILDEATQELSAFKSASTPADPVLGLLNALELGADAFGQPAAEFLADLRLIVHGTTLATNTLITDQGARTGLITTENFRDVIEIRRGLRDQRYSIYNVFRPPYRPLVPRHLRVGVPERVRYNGEVITPLDKEKVRQAAELLHQQGVESVAVGFLYSYANPEHEQCARAICEEIFGPGHVTTSHEVLPVWREYERFSTAVVSAYLEPVVAVYLLSLDDRLRAAGFGGTCVMMLSNGLVESIDRCVGRAVYLLNSGPAAAPSAATYLTRRAGQRTSLLSIDMGGTSFEVCLIEGGEIPATTESWIADHRVATKMVDVTSIGAGGGSIAWIDSLRLLRVGPQSAGADPGPACYGKGLDATVTDADLVLGYLPEDYFLGGTIPLSLNLAREAIERIAERLDFAVDETATAIFKTVNSNMADLITEVATRRGFDVREFSLVAGGGAGPVHSAFLAELLGISTVFVPAVSGLFSAFGMFTMEPGRDYARSLIARSDQVDAQAVDRLFSELEAEAAADAAASGTDPGELTFARTAELRYVGQFHEVEVEMPSGPIKPETLAETVASFHARHESLYTFSMPWMTVDFLTFRLRATARRAQFELREMAVMDADPSDALKRTRTCIWNGEPEETPVYDGDLLGGGSRLEGPAIIEDPATTVVIPAGFVCTVDMLKNYVLERDASAPDLLTRADTVRTQA